MNRLLILMIYLFCTGSLASATDGFVARTSAIMGAESLPLNNECDLGCDSPHVRAMARVPGVGRVQFVFVKRNAAEGAISYLDATRTTADLRPLALLRGEARMRNSTAKAVGSVIELGGQRYLSASFMHQRRHRRRLYRLRIPLDSPKSTLLSRGTFSSSKIDCAELHPHKTDHMTDDAGESHHHFELAEQSITAANTGRELEIAVYTDKTWSERFEDLAAAQATTFFAEAGLVYEEQFGISFALTSVVVADNYDPQASSGSTGAEAAVIDFQEFGQRRPEFGTADAYHLLSDVTLNGGTIGIAYIGVICASEANSFGVTTFTSNVLTPVTIAHELGHNFGGSHVSSGIMGAVATGEGLDTLRFSATSVAEMNSFLGQVNFSCLAESGNSAALSFDANLSRSGDFSFSASVSQPQPGCTLDLKYSLGKGKPFRSFASYPMDGTALSGVGQFSRRANRETRKGNRIRYRMSASYECPLGLQSGTASSLRIRPQRIRSKKKTVGPKRWFRGLESSIVLQ